MQQIIRACLALMAVGVLSAACASKPAVIAAGKDPHGARLYAIAGEPDLNGIASRRADQYCEKHGRSALIENSGFKDSGFTFTCVDAE